MPRATDIAEISQIFLSATAQDCCSYREAVRDMVQNNVPKAKVFLQENWAEGGHFVVDVCRQRFDSCDAYMGLFGHRYGWTPPGFSKSITQLEFDWAVERWSQPIAPLFILLPEKSSDADTKLREWAQLYIEQECPDEESRNRQAQAQEAFLASVRTWAAKGKMLTHYADQQQLVGKALSSIQNWNLAVLRQALAGRRQPPGDIPAEELGRIGRDEQRTALRQALETFRERKGCRAIEFLVHGPENHGQRQFAEFLCRWDEEWKEGGEDCAVLCGQPAEADSIDSLIRWACSQLREPVLSAIGVDALATVLAARLSRQSVVFVQHCAGWHANRLATFQSRFWQPLLAALDTRAPGGKGRLYWFLIDHEVLADDPGAGIRSAAIDDDRVDYSQLLALPALGEISARQVQRWLRELQSSAGIRLDEERRKAIAERVTHPDGLPPNVFDRLTRDGFWASAT